MYRMMTLTHTLPYPRKIPLVQTGEKVDGSGMKAAGFLLQLSLSKLIPWVRDLISSSVK